MISYDLLFGALLGFTASLLTWIIQEILRSFFLARKAKILLKVEIQIIEKMTQPFVDQKFVPATRTPDLCVIGHENFFALSNKVISLCLNLNSNLSMAEEMRAKFHKLPTQQNTPEFQLYACQYQEWIKLAQETIRKIRNEL